MKCRRCKTELEKVRRVVGSKETQVRGLVCPSCGYSDMWDYGQRLEQNVIGDNGAKGRE